MQGYAEKTFQPRSQPGLKWYVCQRLNEGLKPQKVEHLEFFDWVKKYYRLPETPRAPEGKLVFDDKPYLKPIYMAKSPKIVVMKSGQVGISEWAIAQSFYHVIQTRANILYAFPKMEQMGSFVSARVNPIIENSPYIRELMKGARYAKDDVGLKKIGNRFIYFRGSSNRDMITTVDADVIILDELDRMIQHNIDVIVKRLLSSKIGLTRMLSTPSYEKYSIHSEYIKTLYFEWYVKCNICGKEQTVRFPQSFRMEPPEDGYWCDKYGCDGKLNPFKGIWIDKNGNSFDTQKEYQDPIGFHVVGMMNPIIKAIDLINKFKNPETYIPDFYWQSLGYPYNPKGSKMTKSILDACRATEEDPINPIGNHCRMGVDVGKVLHVRISNIDDNGRKIARYIGTVKTFEELERLMRLYDIDVCVIDIKPETRQVISFALKYPGRVWAADFLPVKAGSICEFVERGKYYDQTIPLVKVNRDLALDYVHEELESRNQVLPMNLDSIDGFYDQMCAITKVEVENPKTGNKEYKYISGSTDEHGRSTGAKNPDHYMFASVYEYVAWLAKSRRITGQRKARILG